MRSGFQGGSPGALRPCGVVRLRPRSGGPLLVGLGLVSLVLAAACGQSAVPPPEPAFPTRREAPASPPVEAANAELVAPAGDEVAAPTAAPPAAPAEPAAPIASAPAPLTATGAPEQAGAAPGPAGASSMNTPKVGQERDPSAEQPRAAQRQAELPAAPPRNQEDPVSRRQRNRQDPPPEDPPVEEAPLPPEVELPPQDELPPEEAEPPG